MISDQGVYTDSGFTLIESLIGLLILAISSGLMMQAISLASDQVTSSKRLIAAEQLAVVVLADHSSYPNGDLTDAGTDMPSSLVWRYTKRTIARQDEFAELSAVELIAVEIRRSNSDAVIYKLKTLAMRTTKP